MQLADLFQIGQVGDLAGRNFNERHAQCAQKPHTGDIKRRGKILDANGIAVFFQFPVALKRKMQLANHLQLAFGGIGGLFLVFGFFGEPAHHKLRHSGLVFYNICTAFLSHISHPLGGFQIAVVVYPGFSNDRYRHKLLLSGVRS